MTQQAQAEALRLAAAMDSIEAGKTTNDIMADASDELRRLHARVQELEAQLAAVVGYVPIENGEVHISPSNRDAETAGLREGQRVYASCAGDNHG